ncbi:cupin domain-containing protein [Streptomyces sp. GLT-R25]
MADAIGLLRPHTVIGPSLLAAGEWALRFDTFLHVRIGGLVRGTCWLILEGHEPVLLQEGDTFMLGNPPPYVLGSTPDASPRPAEPVLAGAEDGFVRIGPESEENLYLCVGHIAFDDENAALLTDLLPPLVVVRVADPHGRRLAQLIDLLATEVGVYSPPPAALWCRTTSHRSCSCTCCVHTQVRQTGPPAGWAP